MKIVCDSCGASGPAAKVNAREGHVFATCANCGVEASLGGNESEESAPVPAPLASRPIEEGLPPVKCPKCAHRQDDEYACHKCGLVFGLIEEGKHPWEDVEPLKRSAVRAASELWDAVLASPADRGRHEAFVLYAAEHAISAWAATRYRHYLADYPSDEIAQEFSARTVANAQAVVSVMTPSVEKMGHAVKQWRTAMMVLVTLVMIVLAAWIVHAATRGALL